MSDNSIAAETIVPCCGCGACSVICPHKAISCDLNDEGCISAKINRDLCTNCGLCKQVCLRFVDNLVPDAALLQNGELYAAASSSAKTVSSCTSGGIAWELAEYGYNNGWRVAGTIYNYGKNIAEAVIAENIKELKEMRGSKYLQSYFATTLDAIVREAKADRQKKFMVLGTPCQIYGIKRVFCVKKIKNQLFTVDLFCHGVPAYLLWEKYLAFLRERYGIRDITKVSFRSKTQSWHDFTMKIKSQQGNYCQTSEGDLFYRAFFDNVLLNPACSKCIVRQRITAADIRLGDFWGKRFQGNAKGVSAVLVMSAAGALLLKELAERITIVGQYEPSECFLGQSMHDYDNNALFQSAVANLSKNISLKNVIANYRRSFHLKHRIKLFVKELTALLPFFMRKRIRLWYRIIIMKIETRK